MALKNERNITLYFCASNELPLQKLNVNEFKKANMAIEDIETEITKAKNTNPELSKNDRNITLETLLLEDLIANECIQNVSSLQS